MSYYEEMMQEQRLEASWNDLGIPSKFKNRKSNFWCKKDEDDILEKINILQFYGSCYTFIYQKLPSKLSDEEKAIAKLHIYKAIEIYSKKNNIERVNIFDGKIKVKVLKDIFLEFAEESKETVLKILWDILLNGSKDLMKGI